MSISTNAGVFNMVKFSGFWAVMLSFFILTGCATLSPDFEEPTINVKSFRLLPSQSLSPRFEIVLRVSNPNRTKLDIKGASYSASIEGQELISGVSNKLPTIPAYGEGDVVLEAEANLLKGFRLITTVLQDVSKPIGYNLKVKLDVGTLVPAIVVEKQGQLTK